jgi:hypothetical protein
MLHIIKRAFAAYVAARELRAREHVIELLDERTLRDIGLETQANHAREQARLGAFRVAMY